MNYLTTEQVLFIHARLIAETGGGHDLRDIGLLQSAVERPRVTFDRKDLYPDIFSKAAALLESLIGNQPFVDGNKRTAIMAAGLFLQMNGYRLRAENQEVEAFVHQCTQGSVTLPQMSVWLESHTVKSG